MTTLSDELRKVRDLMEGGNYDVWQAINCISSGRRATLRRDMMLAIKMQQPSEVLMVERAIKKAQRIEGISVF